MEHVRNIKSNKSKSVAKYCRRCGKYVKYWKEGENCMGLSNVKFWTIRIISGISSGGSMAYKIDNIKEEQTKFIDNIRKEQIEFNTEFYEYIKDINYQIKFLTREVAKLNR
jgi:hypothetical protein